jgi:hypothetical protein
MNVKLRYVALLAILAAPLLSAVNPPPGFTALYSGRDLSGWRGGWTFDHREWLAMPEAERAAKDAEWTADMLKHWRAEGDELVNDGKGRYATTVKDYGDIELLIDYKTVARADSGIYLRGCPQVQIWDYTDPAKFERGANRGSGGLWNNNSPAATGKYPLVKADKPFGEWNTFRILMVGSRVSVWLNDQLVVDHAILENHYDRALPPEKRRPVPARGPIQLQTHGGEIRWRKMFVREIGGEEANRILAQRADAGFKSIFNGRDLTGFKGAVDNYQVVDGTLMCKPDKGGVLFTEEQFADFVARLEFKVPPGGNNGLVIRYPGTGRPAYASMCELQVFDDQWVPPPGARPMDPRQAHGSAYMMVAAHRGYQRPTGEWNFQEVTVKGSTITVELNGTVILNTDLSKVETPATAKQGEAFVHAGKNNPSGAFGFAGHRDPVAFRNVRIKRLESPRRGNREVMVKRKRPGRGQPPRARRGAKRLGNRECEAAGATAGR